jgi:methionine-rich copper-binding protein CopC
MAFIVVALAVAVSLAQAAPASDDLTSSDPPDGSALTAAPAAVDLTFSAPPDVDRSHVYVLDDRGSDVGSGPLTRTGTGTLRRPVAILAPGTLTIVYHVTLAGDGEAIGAVQFSVGTGIAPSPRTPPRPHEHSVDPLGAVLLLVDAVVGLGAVALLLRRRWRWRHIKPTWNGRTDA